MGTTDRRKTGVDTANRRRSVPGERGERRRPVTLVVVLVAAVAVVVAAVVARTRTVDEPSAAGPSPGTSAPRAPVTTAPPGSAIAGPTPCPPADGSAARTTSFTDAPPMCIDPSRSYRARVSTGVGDFTIALQPDRAPTAVNNFVVLARYKAFDGLLVHRIVRDTLLSTGDLYGDPPGSGGPGYTIADELPASSSEYRAGAVAMANQGRPNTSGSQWFVVPKDSGMTPAYTIFGQVTEGMDVIARLDSLGTPSGAGVPQVPVLVNSVTIEET